MRGCLCALRATKRTQGLPYGCPRRAPRGEKERSAPALVASRRGSRAAGSEARHSPQKPSSTVYRRRCDETMADAASQKLANDLARAEARKTLWETELAGLASRREDDAAAAAAAVKESVLAREAADPLMTVHGDADANPYARPARGGGGCAVM